MAMLRVLLRVILLAMRRTITSHGLLVVVSCYVSLRRSTSDYIEHISIPRRCVASAPPDNSGASSSKPCGQARARVRSTQTVFDNRDICSRTSSLAKQIIMTMTSSDLLLLLLPVSSCPAYYFLLLMLCLVTAHHFVSVILTSSYYILHAS